MMTSDQSNQRIDYISRAPEAAREQYEEELSAIYAALTQDDGSEASKLIGFLLRKVSDNLRSMELHSAEYGDLHLLWERLSDTRLGIRSGT
jgi:DNA-binding FadR family transcriptional regulator